jgi:hypothetical protein
MKVRVGDIVRLSGKTRHGKNRVRENGEFARVITVDGDGEILSRKICVRHLDKVESWRWMDLPSDEHMDWEGV